MWQGSRFLSVWSQWRWFGGAVALKETPPRSLRTLVEFHRTERRGSRHTARRQGTEQTDHIGSCNCLRTHTTGLGVCLCVRGGGGAVVLSAAAGESLRPECDLIPNSQQQFQGITVESCPASRRETRMSSPAGVGEGSETRNCAKEL